MLAVLPVLLLSLAFFTIGVVIIFLLTKSSKSNTSSIDPQFKGAFESIWKIEKAVLETIDFEEATSKVVNIFLTELGYGNNGYEIVVLTLLDEKLQGLRRIAISRTKSAGEFLSVTPIPFEDIIIPLSATDNLSIQAITEQKMFTTESVADVLYPALSREWVENFQKALGIKTSLVFPIVAKNKIIGTLIFSLSKEKEKITSDEWSILNSYVGAVGIALDNALLFKSLTDITERLRVANEKLQDVDKLKDEFVSLASHELRTPMSIIKSYTWVLLQAKIGDLNEKQKTYMTRIASTTDRLINLVNDMLNVSRIESGRLTIELSKVDIGKLVSDVVAEMQTRAQEFGVSLVFQPAVSLPQVKADLERIKQVVINLIGNSFKFTPKTGTIAVSITVVDGGFVRVSVADNGRGISTSDLQKLFQKFNMVGKANLTKQAGQGTGLGLYISKSLIELQGGRIWAASEGEGKGSVFSFTLPVWTEINAQAAGAGEEISSVPSGLPPAPPVLSR